MRYNRKNELDVDFIGGQEPLTKEEEKAITDYINVKKSQSAKKLQSKSRSIKREKIVA